VSLYSFLAGFSGKMAFFKKSANSVKSRFCGVFDRLNPFSAALHNKNFPNPFTSSGAKGIGLKIAWWEPALFLTMRT
jgi:hypothetical protein